MCRKQTQSCSTFHNAWYGIKYKEKHRTIMHRATLESRECLWLNQIDFGKPFTQPSWSRVPYVFNLTVIGVQLDINAFAFTTCKKCLGVLRGFCINALYCVTEKGKCHLKCHLECHLKCHFNKSTLEQQTYQMNVML